jgi:divalent metal cation (Fe/Co/Zn/Cd) transporter
LDAIEEVQAREVRRGLRLVMATAGYNAVEAGVAVWAAWAAGSLALLAFGLDSVIELVAGAVMLRHLRFQLRSQAVNSWEGGERRVRRIIAATLAALAIYVVADASLGLITGRTPEASPVGMGLAVLSLVVMPALSLAKLRTASRIGSGALRAEAMESLSCAYLAFTLLLGLAANAVAGWGWADAAAALLMVPWLLHEAWEAWHDAT